jgi:hypothetical protein
MSFLEKYKWYQKGVVRQNTPEKMQQFFKTKPTEEQLMLLDDLDKSNIFLVLVLMSALFGLGILLGYAIGIVEATIKLLAAAI